MHASCLSLSLSHTQTVSPTHTYGVSHTYGALTQCLTHIWRLAQNTHSIGHTQHGAMPPSPRAHSTHSSSLLRTRTPLACACLDRGLCRSPGDAKTGGQMQRRPTAPGSLEKKYLRKELSMGSLGIRRYVGAFLAPRDTSRTYSHSGLLPPHGLLAPQVLPPPLAT